MNKYQIVEKKNEKIYKHEKKSHALTNFNFESRQTGIFNFVKLQKNRKLSDRQILYLMFIVL